MHIWVLSEKTTPFGVNLLRSPVLYRAAQWVLLLMYVGRRGLCLERQVEKGI